jgi:DNA-binding FadR family transcriptional regulator
MPLARLSDAISYQLGIDIVRGLYPAGEPIPTEMALARFWNISRTAVREGIRILDSKGLVETRQKTGTTVRQRSQWHLLDPAVLSWMQQAEPDNNFITALFELRLIIEPQAVGLAAKRRSVEDLNRLQKLLEGMGENNRAEDSARRANILFHRTIMNAARNHALIPLAASIEAAVAWSDVYRIGRGLFVRDSLNEHERILDAMRREDSAEARLWMEVLIRSSLELLR